MHVRSRGLCGMCASWCSTRRYIMELQYISVSDVCVCVALVS